jgi:hypothetical protein
MTLDNQETTRHQPASLVEALRASGESVVILSNFEGGVPDPLVGWRGVVNLLMEVKKNARRRNRPIPAKSEFMATWRGHCF